MMNTHQLVQSWRRAWKSISANEDDIADLFELLISHYQEPHRKYHTLQHLAECITTLEPTLGLVEHPGEVEIALWFHDAIYSVKQEENELRSALWARQEVLVAGAPPEVADRIYELVLATRHTALPASQDQKLLVDVDLTILGAPAQRFDEYEHQIRQEYAWVPDDVFRVKRLEILQAFVARPFIYSTSYFRASLEAEARDNIRRSILALQSPTSR